MRTFASLALLSFVLGCAIPSRDNAHDPQNAPSAVLSVVDQTALNPACTQSGAAQNAPEVFVARRTDCLALDATASDDPNGDGLHYAFFRDGDAEPFFESETVRIAVVPEGFLDDVRAGEQIRFHAEVGDGGARSRADAAVAITNAAPVARADSPRLRAVIPGAAPYAVLFDGGDSADPDEDDLEFCWTFSDSPGTAPECGPRLTHATRSKNVDATRRHSVVARLEVTDPDGEAAVFRSVFRVGDPAIWTASKAGATPIIRVDAERDVVPGFGIAPQVAVLDSRIAITYLSASFAWEMTAAVAPDAMPVGTPIVLGAVRSSSVVADAANDRVLAFVDSSLGLRIDSYGFAADGSLLPGASLTLGGAIEYFPTFATAAISSSGGIWIGRQQFGRELWHVDTALASAEAITATSGRLFTGFGARPESGEAWTVETYDYETANPVLSGPARILRYGPDGVLPPVVTQQSLLNALAWVDSTTFWTFSADEGLLLIDAGAIDAGKTFEDATLLAFPDLLDVSSILVEPSTGICWTSSLADFTYRATPDGTLTVYQSSFPSPVLVESDGSVWYTSEESDGFQLRHGLTTDADGRIGSAIYFQYGTTSEDVLTGGVWIASVTPNRLVHLDAAGRLDRTLEILELDGAPVAMPPMFPFRIGPNGTTAWAMVRDYPNPLFSYAALSLIRVEIGGNPTATTVLTATSAASLSSGGYHPMLEPGETAAGPFVWAFDYLGQRIVRVSDAGVETAAAVGPGVDYVVGAASRATSALCSGATTGGNTLALTYQGSGDPAPVALATHLSSVLRATAVSTENGEDVCWFAYQESAGSFVEAWNADGSPRHAAVQVGPPTAFGAGVSSIRAASHDKVYLTEPRKRIEWSGGAPTLLDYPGSGTDVLVGNDADFR